jgi:CBS domain containing-hemolysin-like protein
MTILHKAAMLPLDSIVSTELLLRIAEEGHSRLPIYNTARQNVVGVLLTKVPLACLRLATLCKPLTPLQHLIGMLPSGQPLIDTVQLTDIPRVLTAPTAACPFRFIHPPLKVQGDDPLFSVLNTFQMGCW